MRAQSLNAIRPPLNVMEALDLPLRAAGPVRLRRGDWMTSSQNGHAESNGSAATAHTSAAPLSALEADAEVASPIHAVPVYRGPERRRLTAVPSPHGVTESNGHSDGHSNGGSLMPTTSRPVAGRRSQKRASVSLVIPAKNEARNLPTVLNQVPARVDEVILVDGHSTDVTQLMARSCMPDIRIVSQDQRGKGHALRAGFEAARGDIIVAMDADGSMAPEEIPHFVYFLEHGYDFVKGSRFVAGGGSLDLTPLRRLGNRGLLAVANALFRAKLTDLCYGYFAFYRRYLDHLDLVSSGFEIETELTVRALISGLRVAEIPSLEMPRRSGRSNLRSFPDGARVLRTILREHKAAGMHRV
jgi:Glycosyl transferase family 2